MLLERNIDRYNMADSDDKRKRELIEKQLSRSSRPSGRRVLSSRIFVTKVTTRTRTIGFRFKKTRTRIMVVQKTDTKYKVKFGAKNNVLCS